MITKALIAVALAIPFALAACGGDDNGSENGSAGAATETTSTEAASGPGGTVKISETDFKLNPSNPNVKSGTVTFQVSNDGQTTHNLEIEGNGVEQKLDSDLAPGDSGTLTLDLPPGTYEIYCPVDGHKDLGMTGELTVQ